MNNEDWNLLRHAMELVEEGELDEANAICVPYLEDDPNNNVALNIVCAALLKANQPHMAYQLGKRLTEIAPKSHATWVNYGRAAIDLWRISEGIRAYKQGLLLAMNDKDKCILLINISAAYVDLADYDKAEQYARLALEINPDSENGKGNLGICQLAKREWREGWRNYHYTLGKNSRTILQYGDEPPWEGQKGKTVALYCDQGIGDSICFVSALKEAIADCDKVILDCHAKLETLFKRSFPDARVYGTRKMAELDWEPEDTQIDYSLALGQLGEIYRNTDESFHGMPYIVPDEDKVTMWKALFATKNKPVIGIGWSGGARATGDRYRRAPLKDWLPLFEAIDAHWVCLEYKPAQEEIDDFLEEHPEIDLKEYPNATLTNDYDDTAGMVAALDCVVSVPTSVWHLAGSMGVPLVALKHIYPCWKATSGMPFHPVTKFVDWQGSWKRSIAEAVQYVEDLCNIRYSSVGTHDSR